MPHLKLFAAKNITALAAPVIMLKTIPLAGVVPARFWYAFVIAKLRAHSTAADISKI